MRRAPIWQLEQEVAEFRTSKLGSRHWEIGLFEQGKKNEVLIDEAACVSDEDMRSGDRRSKAGVAQSSARNSNPYRGDFREQGIKYRAEECSFPQALVHFKR